MNLQNKPFVLAIPQDQLGQREEQQSNRYEHFSERLTWPDLSDNRQLNEQDLSLRIPHEDEPQARFNPRNSASSSIQSLDKHNSLDYSKHLYNDAMEFSSKSMERPLSNEINRINRSIEPAERVGTKLPSQQSDNRRSIHDVDFSTFQNLETRTFEEGERFDSKNANRSHQSTQNREANKLEPSDDYQVKIVDDPAEWAKEQIERIKRNEQSNELADQVKHQEGDEKMINEPSEQAKLQEEKLEGKERDSIDAEEQAKQQIDDASHLKSSEENAKDQLEQKEKKEEKQDTPKNADLIDTSVRYEVPVVPANLSKSEVDRPLKIPGEEISTQQSTFRVKTRKNSKDDSGISEAELTKRLTENIPLIATNLSAAQKINKENQDHPSARSKHRDRPEGPLNEIAESSSSNQSYHQDSARSPNQNSVKTYEKSPDKVLNKRFRKRLGQDASDSGSRRNDSPASSRQSEGRDSSSSPANQQSRQSRSKKNNKSLGKTGRQSAKDTPSPQKRSPDNSLVMSILKKRSATPASQTSGRGNTPGGHSEGGESSRERSNSSNYRRRNKPRSKKHTLLSEATEYLNKPKSKSEKLSALQSSIGGQQFTPEELKELSEISSQYETENKAGKAGRNFGNEFRRPSQNLRKLKEAEKVFQDRHKEKDGDFQNSFLLEDE